MLTHLLLPQLVLSSQNTCLPVPQTWGLVGLRPVFRESQGTHGPGCRRSTEMMLSKCLVLKRPVSTTVSISIPSLLHGRQHIILPLIHSFNTGESMNAFNPSSCSGPGEGRWVHTQMDSTQALSSRGSLFRGAKVSGQTVKWKEAHNLPYATVLNYVLKQPPRLPDPRRR